MKQDYMKLHILSNFKKGDKVKIIKKCKSFENGWDCCWIKQMDEFVGKCGIIESDGNEKGFNVRVKNDTYEQYWFFPYFILSCRNLKIKHLLKV